MLALLFGILSAALMFAFLSSRNSGDDLDGRLGVGDGAETVVVLTRDVKAGEKITSDMLTTQTMPAGALLSGHITDLAEVEGKIATASMVMGEQVVTQKVTSFEDQTTLAYKVPEGMRGISLMVPHEAWITGGLPQPGDRIDILGITTLVKVDPLTGEEKPDVVAGIIAQDVEVLAVSQTLVKKIVRSNPVASATAGAGAGDPALGAATTPVVEAAEPDPNAESHESAISITLALPPDLAAKVAIIDAMDDSSGQFRVMARQKGDEAPVTGQQTWSLDEVFTTTN